MGRKAARSRRTIFPHTLVLKKLEKVSKTVFSKYYKQITDLIGNSHGIYALYDDTELYYVGKSTDLKKRVRQHLKDRHLASWTHFSLYLVRNADQIGEMESLLIRIANPRGNTKKYKSDKGGSLLKQLQSMIRQKQAEEFGEMFGIKAKSKGMKPKKKHPETLEGLVKKKTLIYRSYKGKDYKAILTTKGNIRLGDKVFATPTAAAKSIVKRAAVNGWAFWYIKDMNGEWVKLSDYR